MGETHSIEYAAEVVRKYFLVVEELTKTNNILRLKIIPNRLGYIVSELRELYRELAPKGFHILLREYEKIYLLEIYKAENRRSPMRIFIIALLTTLATVFITSYIWVSSLSLGYPQIIFRSILLSATILIPLAVHELGHYTISRYYRIPSTIPVFIPGIPGFTLGTFGAVIFARSLPPTLEELSMLALAGPLAGTISSLLFVVYGLSLSEITVGTPPPGSIPITSVPLAFMLLERLLFGGREGVIILSPEATAAYYLLLIHFMNLLPVGQLDGGQILRSLVSQKLHAMIGLITVSIFIVISIISRDPLLQIISVFLLLMYILTGSYPHQGASYDQRIYSKKVFIVFISWILLVALTAPIPL
ncbi:MAG: site-2 protease family protein [Sulfolobales archaeon]